MQKGDFSLYDDYDLSKIFGENHKSNNSFESFKNAVKFGKISLEFVYSPKLAREFLNKSNNGFYSLIRNLKNLGSLIFLLFVVIKNNEYNFLWTLPAIYLIRHSIHFLWYRKLSTTVFIILIIIISCYIFKLELSYLIFLAVFTVLQSITFSAYSLFMEQYFSNDEVRLSYALEERLIKRIYDSSKNKIIEV